MQPVPTGYPIAELTGPFVVGGLLNWGLFGTLSVQLYLYYLAFPNDRRFTKCLVYCIYVTELVQTTLISHDVFSAFGYGFGDMDALTRENFYWLTVPIMNAVVASVGQVFYAYRIFVLSKLQIFPILIICLSLIHCVASILTGIYAFQAGNITKLDNLKMHIAVGTSCGTTALCDILIAVCTTYYLMSSTTNFYRTRTLVTKIICLTVETGSVTAVVSLLSFIFFIGFPHQTFYIIPALLEPKLYANSIYMVLNSRFQIIGGRDTNMSSTDMSFSTTMIRDILSQSIEEARPAVGTQGQGPVVVVSSEVFDDSHGMDQVNFSHGAMPFSRAAFAPKDKPRERCISFRA
ncbi:hypothetical protein EDD18DRAFT_1363566 [Armillaria luteobubalina]|uniref:DUF6534 domain-containing protein n=1 Tax=Armillaria luteobubalina TaxID=153913 RepID=A0AA39PB57_9AGAR|nr:hypothetical protein EDD18DRAFT_1363566 [Armillaria luteobubalina]